VVGFEDRLVEFAPEFCVVGLVPHEDAGYHLGGHVVPGLLVHDVADDLFSLEAGGAHSVGVVGLSEEVGPAGVSQLVGQLHLRLVVHAL
jgi:hypothetical protein